MSTFDYAEIADEAAVILEEFGAAVTLRNVPIPTYNPATDTVTPGTVVEDTRYGAMFDFGGGELNGPGGLVQVGDKRCLIEVGTFAPSLEDQLVDSLGVVWTIKGVGKIEPAGIPVLYDLHCRK